MNTQQFDIILIVLSIFTISLISLCAIHYKLHRDMKKNTYKIGEITDNLNRKEYKILAKKKDNTFMEFEKFPIIKANIAPRIDYYAKNSWTNLDEAEEELKKFKIIIGQIKYEKKIVVK